MRIISQNGKSDLPYERVAISINFHDEKEIIAWSVDSSSNDNDNYLTMARYSTAEKANKAMEMLRIAYAGKFITTADIPNDFDSQLKEMMKHGFGAVTFREFDDCKVEFNNLNGYFIFPKDDEIEVEYEE